MKSKNELLLREAPMSKLLVKMVVPATFGILLYNLYNIINTLYVARGIGTYAAGGVAVTTPVFLILAAVSTTMGNGAGALISMSLGQGNREKANKIAANTFLVFWSVAILFTVFGLLFLDRILIILGVTENLLPYARDYLRIIIAGSITSTGFSSIMRAEGNTKYAMYQWLIPVAVNMVLDPILIFVLKLGVKGAAIATLISQISSVSMSMYYFFLSDKSSLKIKPRHFRPEFNIIREIAAIGMPSFIQMVSQSLSIVIVNNFLKLYGGDLAISAYGIASRITTFLIIPQTGIVQGFQPIAGYNYGAKRFERVKDAVRLSSITAGIYGAIVLILVLLFPQFLMGFFSTDKAAISLGAVVLKLTNLAFPVSGIQMLQATYFQSIGKPFISLVLSLCSYMLMFVPVLIILSRFFGLTGIWLSFPLSAVFSFLISGIFVLRSFRKFKLPRNSALST